MLIAGHCGTGPRGSRSRLNILGNPKCFAGRIEGESVPNQKSNPPVGSRCLCAVSPTGKARSAKRNAHPESIQFFSALAKGRAADNGPHSEQKKSTCRRYQTAEDPTTSTRTPLPLRPYRIREPPIATTRTATPREFCARRDLAFGPKLKCC